MGRKQVKASESAREAAMRLLDQQAIRFHKDGTFRDWDNAVQAFTQAEARGREQMADAVRKAMQDGYPEPPTKGDECDHGKFGWEDCIACYDTALEAAILSPIPGEPK